MQTTSPKPVRRKFRRINKAPSGALTGSPLSRRRSVLADVSSLRSISVPEVMSGLGYIYNCVDQWANFFPDASGYQQSPVNLDSREAVYDPTLLERPLSFKYEISREVDVCNNGHTVVIYPAYRPGESVLRNSLTETLRSTLSGGPLPPDHLYDLSEIRFHWGRDERKGSEHTVNGMAYPMELQLIHYDASVYKSLEEALGQVDGVTIVALFVQVSRDHHGLRLVTDHLADLSYKGRQKTINSMFNPNCLLPDVSLRDYWTYPGSLTVPPCFEHVTWILLRYPLTISHYQMEEFRRLRNYYKGEPPEPADEGSLVDNFRPIQPLNGRVMRASFQ